jgi:ribA/ribD-fused uncharacterized protein
MEKYTFFWGGPFSQWARSPFVVDGVNYNTAEQFMMAQKALLFKDHEVFKKIIKSKKPAEQKALGRQVKNFDGELWESKCKEIVYQGNYAKFTQNKSLYNALMETRGTELVEASPEDKIWGIGLHKNDPRSLDKSQWLGTNWLGEIITKVREDLIKEHK